MRFGAQVRQVGGFLAALGRAEEMGAQVVQLFAQNNRQWRHPHHDDEVYLSYRERAAASPIVELTVCHAPYLINLISHVGASDAAEGVALHRRLRRDTTSGASTLRARCGPWCSG